MKGRKKNPADRIVTLLSQVKEGRLVIPEDMVEILDGLFDRFNVIMHQQEDAILHLVSIVVPGTVKRIGERAFSGCSNLEEIFFVTALKASGATPLRTAKSSNRFNSPQAQRRSTDGPFMEAA